MEKKKRPDRLERLEEALYSRNAARLPKTERLSLLPREEQEPLEEEKESVSLSDLVSRETEHPHRKLFEKIFLFSVAFAILAAGFAGYRFFLGGPSVSEKNISIIMAGPSIVGAAVPLSIDLRVENRNARSIENAVLKLEYPKGARAANDRTRELSTDTVNIGSLGAGKSSNRQISMILFGQKDDVQTFVARLEYRVPGSQATFVKEEVFELAIGSAPVILGVSIPKTTVSREPFDISLSVKSNSPEPIANVVLSAEYPFGFSFISSEPKPFANNNVWRLGDVPEGNTKTVYLKGSLEAENNEERTFKFSVAVSGGAAGSATNQIASSLETIGVSKPLLSLKVGVAGGESSLSTQPGERIPIEISWTNNLATQITDARIEATLTGIFDENNILAQYGGFYDSRKHSIVWQQSGNEDLANISPGSSGRVRFVLAIPKFPPGEARNQGVSVRVVMEGSQPESTVPITADALLSFKFKANPSVSAYATRESSVFDQTGPVPPRANQTTTYAVVMSAGSSFADVNNALLKMSLPPNVSWNDISSPGNEKITFDDKTRTLSWLIGNVSADDRARTVTIGLSLTPSVSQIGFTPSLLSRPEFVGTDAFTGEEVKVSLDDVTTALPQDGNAPQNAGTVVK